jgi:hypothetical protein
MSPIIATEVMETGPEDALSGSRGQRPPPAIEASEGPRSNNDPILFLSGQSSTLPTVCAPSTGQTTGRA